MLKNTDIEEPLLPQPLVVDSQPPPGHRSLLRRVLQVGGGVMPIPLFFGSLYSLANFSMVLDDISNKDGSAAAEQAGDGLAMIYLCTVALAIALVAGILYCKAGIHREYHSDFDTIVQEVANRLQQGSQENFAAASDCNSVVSEAPVTRVYHLEDRTFGISHKKSGKILLAGTNASSVVRLHLTFLESSRGASIEGHRTSSDTNHQSANHNYLIKQGFVCAISKKAYWAEVSNQGLRRVVTGQFDSDFSSFTGEWLSCDGSRGSLRNASDDNLVCDYGIPLDVSAEP